MHERGGAEVHPGNGRAGLIGLRRPYNLIVAASADRSEPQILLDQVHGGIRDLEATQQGEVRLHVFEIGNTGTTGKKRTELIDGVNFLGAASEAGPFAIFGTSDSPAQEGEVSLPDVACDSLIASGLLPDTIYELSFTGPNVSSSPAAVLPGVLADQLRVRTNSHGVLRLEHAHLRNLRLRIGRV